MQSNGMIYVSVLTKTVFGFALLWGITRVLGQKQISQLTLFDYITGITIGSLTAELISPTGNWPPMVLSLIAWGGLTWLLNRVNLFGRSLHRILDGSPSIVIRKGKIVEAEMKRVQLNMQELASLLRVKGFFSVEEVEFALLETNGQLSVLPKSERRPVQPRDLGLTPEYEGLSSHVIHEGRVLKHGLQQAGYEEEWLMKRLRQQDAKLEQVFSAWINSAGKLVVDRYDPKPPKQ